MTPSEFRQQIYNDLPDNMAVIESQSGDISFRYIKGAYPQSMVASGTVNAGDVKITMTSAGPISDVPEIGALIMTDDGDFIIEAIAPRIFDDKIVSLTLRVKPA